MLFSRGLQLPPSDTHDDATYFRALDRFQSNVFQLLRRHYSDSDDEPFCQIVALKAANAFAADYHYKKRASVLVSRPVQLQIDPTNACHMRCPSCLHSANEQWSARFNWPLATLSVRDFESFCKAFGPFATRIALFRDGEPLLHRRFHEFVTVAKSYLLYTATSTSLSMRMDPDAIVASGLDQLVASVDGGPETYERYRRGGDFSLVIGNLRSIVRARLALGRTKPWLVWRFLAFEHNVHEIGHAATLAREIGVDEFVVARPHSVEHDDPDIKVAGAAPFGTKRFSQPENWCSAEDRRRVIANARRIADAFRQSWWSRYRSVVGKQRWEVGGGDTCSWLYYSLTMDAARRITPCCLPPMGAPAPRHLVFSNFDNNADDVVNSSAGIQARQSCRSRIELKHDNDEAMPFCIRCDQNPPPPIPVDVAGYLAAVDDRRALPPSIPTALEASRVFMWPAEVTRR